MLENFIEVSVGSWFSYLGRYYIKIVPIKDADGIFYNAVNLHSGNQAFFLNTDKVKNYRNNLFRKALEDE